MQLHTNDIDTPKRFAIVRYSTVEDKLFRTIASWRLALIAWCIGIFHRVMSRSISFKMNWNVSLVTRKFSYHCCSSNSVSAMSNHAWLLGLTHRLLLRKFWQATCAIAANNHFSFRIFSRLSPRFWSISLLNQRWLFLFRFKSHFTLKMRCKMTPSCLSAISRE